MPAGEREGGPLGVPFDIPGPPGGREGPLDGDPIDPMPPTDRAGGAGPVFLGGGIGGELGAFMEDGGPPGGREGPELKEFCVVSGGRLGLEVKEAWEFIPGREGGPPGGREGPELVGELMGGREGPLVKDGCVLSGGRCGVENC
jgi:hypothetical protein